MPNGDGDGILSDILAQLHAPGPPGAEVVPEAERRANLRTLVAAVALGGLLAERGWGTSEYGRDQLAREAVGCADALLARLAAREG